MISLVHCVLFALLHWCFEVVLLYCRKMSDILHQYDMVLEEVHDEMYILPASNVMV